MQAPIALTQVALATPVLDESVDFYASSFGLTEVLRGKDQVMLAAVAAGHPVLTLQRSEAPRLTGLSFAMRDADALEAIHRRLKLAGNDCTPQRGQCVAFRDPDGTIVTLHVGEDVSAGALPAPSDQPLFLSHVVLNSTDPERLITFYRDVVGLRLSDEYENGSLTFLRCDQPQHHCVGISANATAGLNHFAMDCGHVDAVMRGISRMHRRGYAEIWGPGRHGPGGNIFCYFEDPAGFVAEYTCDVLQIDDAWQPKLWKRTPETGNTWLSGGPTDRAIALMSGTALPVTPVATDSSSL